MQYFVSDGRERGLEAAEPDIRKEIEAEYAAQIATASFVQRWWIKREISKRVSKRLADIYPPDALY